MDIDIDVAPSLDLGAIFPEAVRASTVKKDQLAKHPVGMYFQNIPVDPITKLSAIPFESAKDFGFFKFDFLNLHTLDLQTSKESVRRQAETEPNWDLLKDPEVVSQLFHLSKHYDIVSDVEPRSVQELADCLALIRPGKRRLLNSYIRNPEQVRPSLYAREAGDTYSYKRSHAIAYALVIVLQLHALGGGKSLATDDLLVW